MKESELTASLTQSLGLRIRGLVQAKPKLSSPAKIMKRDFGDRSKRCSDSLGV